MSTNVGVEDVVGTVRFDFCSRIVFHARYCRYFEFIVSLEPNKWGRFEPETADEEDGGNGGEVEADSEDDNAIDRSRFLRGPVKEKAQESRAESDAALLSNSIDFLNSIDGAYLLANAAEGASKKSATDNDNNISTRKPEGELTAPDAGENELFEQMEKKAKSYRLKLYKKHKNFKHTHHHRGGLYHQPYHSFHHDYYRRKMLERDRERWKKMQELKPDYQGQINYYENSNKLETSDDIMAHLNGHSSQEKWPHFDKDNAGLAKHRHRRANGEDGGFVSALEGGGGAPEGEENFIALAPDEADIYNFSNIMSMTMANGGRRAAAAAATASAGGTRADNVNEANPFNEFRNHPRQRGSRGQPPEPDLVDEQLPRPVGEKELPELTLDDDDAGGDDEGDGGDGNAFETVALEGPLRGRFEPETADEEDGGNGGEVEADSEDDNAIDRSRFLRGPVKEKAQESRAESDAALLSNSIDFLNSIDGAYLLANAAEGASKKSATDNDNNISTRKPEGELTAPDAGENELFEQMEKKAKSYRLKLYKKHKNFKHTHHHRGGLYHQPYHSFHHDYYRRKMLERDRERWKKMQELKPDYQGQINYYENSNKLETSDDIMAHLNGHSSQEKWPHFDKVMSSLKTEQKPDNVPPYIKKYNRRNKQLIDLLEGTIAPLSDYGAHKHRERKYHRRKNPHWMEEDLFEEQRPSQSKNAGLQRNYIQETIQSSTVHSNALPGEGIHIIYDKKHGGEDGGGRELLYGRPTISSGHPGPDGHPNAYKLSSRAGQFVYHRVASPQPVGGYGRLKRQRLPFVAITDRRLSAPPKRRTPNGNGNGSNNLRNHQPMP
ncbi:AGAP003933-PA-like protein [Anopheles sinensis]|uniref:AGAP003933-PA-like protein n=1 Tax=Anopheles sinensis TaxID=74873 RepID=A0A084W940_ANOSI|nr:AGAP003933-PA-like protein [Anopheles sinensis]